MTDEPLGSHVLELELADVIAETADARSLVFTVPAGSDIPADRLRYSPGQFLTLRVPSDRTGSVARCYSLSSSPFTDDRLTVTVKRTADGYASNWLCDNAHAGMKMHVLAPSGTFVPKTLDTDFLLLAAGSGITPMMSIAESVLAADTRSRVTLFYGNRRADTVMFADELADLKDLYPTRFQLGHVLSREPREAELLSGRLDAERLAALVDGFVDVRGVDHWWLCGPHEMVQGAQKLLGDLGVPEERVHRELFFADDEPVRTVRHEDAVAEGPVSQVTVTLDGRSTTSPLPRGTTILDGASRVRPDLPFACKGGVCGTCRALVTEGEADMRRNYALEPSEVAAGYVLTCQTFPVSETLTVDFDS